MSSTWRQRLVNLCELEVSMTYMVNLSPDELLVKTSHTHKKRKQTNDIKTITTKQSNENHGLGT